MWVQSSFGQCAKQHDCLVAQLLLESCAANSGGRGRGIRQREVEAVVITTTPLICLEC